MEEGNWVPPTPHEEDSGPFTPKEHLGPGTQLPQDPKGIFVSSDAPQKCTRPPKSPARWFPTLLVVVLWDLFDW